MGVNIQTADNVFRQAMLIKWGAPDRIECFTCGNFFVPELIDTGHIMRRDYYGTRWMEENARPQCRVCNRGLHGNHIEEKIPSEEYERLRSIAIDPRYRMPTKEDLKAIIEKYSL